METETVNVASGICPRCAEALSVGDSGCLVCGWPAEHAPWSPRVEPPAAGESEPLRSKPATVRPLIVAVGWVALFNLTSTILVGIFVDSGRLPDEVSILILMWLYGALAAEICLLGVWGALGPYRFVRRLLYSSLALVLLLIPLLMGVSTTARSQSATIDFLGVMLMVPLVCVAMQAPLWLARLLMLWRIEPAGLTTGGGDRRAAQLGIGDLLLGTAMAAVAIALAKLGFSIGDGGAETWLPLLIVAGVCAALSGLCCLPCVWAALAAKTGAAGSLAVAGSIAATAPPLILISVYSFQMSAAEAISGAFALVAGLCGVQLVFLRGVRSCGYRLAGRFTAASPSL